MYHSSPRIRTGTITDSGPGTLLWRRLSGVRTTTALTVTGSMYTDRHDYPARQVPGGRTIGLPPCNRASIDPSSIHPSIPSVCCARRRQQRPDQPKIRHTHTHTHTRPYSYTHTQPGRREREVRKRRERKDIHCFVLCTGLPCHSLLCMPLPLP